MHPVRADIPALPPIALVGHGRVGGAIARTLREAGGEIATAGRDDLADVLRDAEIALLCVPDSEIEPACATVAASARRLRLCGHTSGATGLGALSAAADAGAETFSLHPLQTLPSPDAELLGSPAAIEGSTPAALDFAARLAEALGMRPFALPAGSRATYHAAASMASNFLVTLEESAVELLRRAGVEDCRELLAPLVLRTAANWAESGPGALTGPIARGDEETVESHLRAITAEAPELEGVYRALAERTGELASAREASR